MDEDYRVAVELRHDLPVLGLIGLLLAAGALALPHLPVRVPVHWNAAGRADRWGAPAFAAFFPPASTLGVWLLMLLLPAIDPRRRRYAQFAGVYRQLRLLVVLALSVLHGAALGAALGHPAAMPVVAALVPSAIFLVAGNLLQRVRPVWFVGIRTPWTLSSDEVWRRTHRFGGRLLMLAGFVPLWGLVGTPATALRLTLVAAVGAGAAAVVYSYAVYRRIEGGAGR